MTARESRAAPAARTSASRPSAVTISPAVPFPGPSTKQLGSAFAKKDIATIIGIGGMAGSIGGILFPWFSGWLLDRLPATQGYAILFAICASAYLIAFGIHHALCPRLEPLPERAAVGA